jgi:hypothetical protein
MHIPRIKKQMTQTSDGSKLRPMIAGFFGMGHSVSRQANSLTDVRFDEGQTALRQQYQRLEPSVRVITQVRAREKNMCSRDAEPTSGDGVITC